MGHSNFVIFLQTQNYVVFRKKTNEVSKRDYGLTNLRIKFILKIQISSISI